LFPELVVHGEDKCAVETWLVVQDVQRMKKGQVPLMGFCYEAYFDDILSEQCSSGNEAPEESVPDAMDEKD
jgi:hypothetical protein